MLDVGVVLAMAGILGAVIFANHVGLLALSALVAGIGTLIINLCQEQE